MKKLLLYFLLSFSMHAKSVQEQQVFLLSYPRSGNTWLRYLIEYLTHRPTCEHRYASAENIHNTLIKAPIGNFFSIGTDLERSPVIKLHVPKLIEKRVGNGYLIFILRNYKECIPRHLRHFSKVERFLEKKHNLYYRNIRFFDKWPEDRRCLIYYEDLIANPQLVCERLTDFLEEGRENISCLLQELDIHKKNCISLYEKNIGKSFTKGNLQIYHSKKKSLEQKKRLDEIVFNTLGKKLFRKYLSHYSVACE